MLHGRGRRLVSFCLASRSCLTPTPIRQGRSARKTLKTSAWGMSGRANTGNCYVPRKSRVRSPDRSYGFWSR